MFSFWSTLEPQKRILFILSAAALLAAMVALFRVATAPSMALLYAGLDAEASGAIVEALDRQQVGYEVRGDAIYVESNSRDRMRMTLAAEGLPANSVQGYELLQGLSGFGTTSQMFDAAYWQAKEGELARTILSNPDIRAARVHIANPVRRAFDRDEKSSASVTVTTSGGQLDAGTARAIRYMVASAVAGLSPDSVTVIDSQAGVVLSSGESGAGALSSEESASRAAELKLKVERMLEARVGPGRAVVEVSVDVNRDAETVRERVLDPEGRVAISSESEESTGSSSGKGGGGVTVASNLPDGEANASGSENQSSNSETRERVNYEVSEVLRERVRQPGETRRITVAVLVDGVVQTAANGTETITPRPQEELDVLKNLVQAAIGYDEARGDIVTIQSLELQQPAGLGTAASGGFGQLLAANAMSLIQLVVLAVVALVLGLFVLRPLLAPAPAEASAAEDDGVLDDLGDFPVFGSAMDGDGDMLSFDQGPVDKLTTLRETITSRSEETGNLLRNWIEESPELAEELS